MSKKKFSGQNMLKRSVFRSEKSCEISKKCRFAQIKKCPWIIHKACGKVENSVEIVAKPLINNPFFTKHLLEAVENSGKTLSSPFLKKDKILHFAQKSKTKLHFSSFAWCSSCPNELFFSSLQRSRTFQAFRQERSIRRAQMQQGAPCQA